MVHAVQAFQHGGGLLQQRQRFPKGCRLHGVDIALQTQSVGNIIVVGVFAIILALCRIHFGGLFRGLLPFSLATQGSGVIKLCFQRFGRCIGTVAAEQLDALAHQGVKRSVFSLCFVPQAQVHQAACTFPTVVAILRLHLAISLHDGFFGFIQTVCRNQAAFMQPLR